MTSEDDRPSVPLPYSSIQELCDKLTQPFLNLPELRTLPLSDIRPLFQTPPLVPLPYPLPISEEIQKRFPFLIYNPDDRYKAMFHKMLDIIDGSGRTLHQREAAECDYISHWESLIGETLQLLSSTVPDMQIIMMRNTRDKFQTGSLVESSRPDMLCWLGSALVIRGEEKAAERDLLEAEHELYDKFGTWNPLFYGDSPFIFGYATGGMSIK